MPDYSLGVGRLITDMFGNRLVQASMPFYKKWRRDLKDDALFHISPQYVLMSGEDHSADNAEL
jgi:hypothetical protein